MAGQALRRLAAGICAVAAAWLAVPRAEAAPTGSTDVDLELVLAVDISQSMDYDEQRVQRDGYVQAFKSQDVIEAITDGMLGRIAVSYVEWSNTDVQFIVVPWMLIDGKDSAYAFADKLASAPLHRWQNTSISGALTFAAGYFDQANYQPLKRTIDVSGDGPNNNGRPVLEARDAVLAKGITINGLPIMLSSNQVVDQLSLANLDVYYKQCVIGGPDSFLFTIEDVPQFPTAIRRKLIQEIAVNPPYPAKAGAIPVQAPAPSVDCLIGEKLRRGGGFP